VAADHLSRPSPRQPSAWIAEDRGTLAEKAQAWLTSPALEHVVRALDGPPDAPRDRDALRRWSCATLDTRGGAERRDVAPVKWNARWAQALLEAAEPLGLISTAAPRLACYDAALVLGGATTGNRLRVELADDLVRHGVHFHELVLLGAERPLGARELADEPSSEADRTEWRNLLRYATQEFGPLGSVDSEAGGAGVRAWRDQRYRSACGRAVRLLVTPSPTGDRRATTIDAIGFFLQRTPHERRRSVLIITSAIYAPYQFFSALPLLVSARAHHAELIGTPTSRDGDPALLAQRVGQETHAAIVAACAVLAAPRPP
jgi:hypothetical protein